MTELSTLPSSPLSVRQRLVREGAWVAGGQIVTALALLMGTRLTTEFVPPAVYGTANLLMNMVLLGKNMFCTPMMNASLRFHPEMARVGELWRLRHEAKRVLLPTTAALTAMLLLAGGVYSRCSGMTFLVFIILSVLLVIDVAQNLEVHLWIGARRQQPVSVAMAVDSLLRPLIVVVLVLLLGASPQTLLLAYSAAGAMIYGGSLLLMRREGTERSQACAGADDSLGRDMLRYALPLMPLALMSWITSLSDRYIIGGMLGAKEVGIYAAAFALMSQPFLIGYGTISRTLTPVYYQAISEGNYRRAERIFVAWLGATVAVGLLGFVAVLLLRQWIARFMLAEEYRSAASLMPWIAAGYCVYSVAWVFEKKLYGNKQTVRLLGIHAVVAASAVIVPLVLIRYYALSGVAAGCLIHFVVMALLMVVCSGEQPLPRRSRSADPLPQRK